jgi:membrane protease YdiL (CAAX protease family)
MVKLILFLEVLLVSLLWAFSFNGPLNFWYAIFGTALVMITLAVLHGVFRIIRPKPSDVLTGVLWGLLLFAITWVSSYFVRHHFPFLNAYVEATKGLRSLAPSYVYVPVVFTVSTAEEFFWRGTVQRLAILHFGKLPGYLMAVALYVFAHVLSGNWALTLASLFAGLFWGFLLMLHRDLTPVWVSHIVWDALLLGVGI